MKAAPVTGKISAIRAVMRRRGRAMTIDELLPLMESKLKMVIGRSKLYTLLSVMMVDGEIKAVGRGRERTYELIAREKGH